MSRAESESQLNGFRSIAPKRRCIISGVNDLSARLIDSYSSNVCCLSCGSSWHEITCALTIACVLDRSLLPDVDFKCLPVVCLILRSTTAAYLACGHVSRQNLTSRSSSGARFDLNLHVYLRSVPKPCWVLKYAIGLCLQHKETGLCIFRGEDTWLNIKYHL